MNINDSLLAQLPEELLQETLLFLDGKSLSSLARSCRWAFEKAIPLIWLDVELVDCRTRHLSDGDVLFKSDDHDDTPIIRKLIVLASNKFIASQVQTLTHRCHLPPPALFVELPQTNFQSRFLSHDPRTLHLLELACANLSNLQTLKIIFGHWHITKGLLNGILDKSRNPAKPLRRLWIENCAITGLSPQVLRDPDLRGLESLRLRRLRLLFNTGSVIKQHVYTRANDVHKLQDGQGARYTTTTAQWSHQEIPFGNCMNPRNATNFQSAFENWEEMFRDAHTYDDMIYDNILRTFGTNLDHYRNDLWDHKDRLKYHFQKASDYMDLPFLEMDPFPAAMCLLEASSSSLTSLNLDWIIIRRVYGADSSDDVHKLMTAFQKIFSLRFPHLRAFQLRNSVVKECKIPDGLFLLDYCPRNLSSGPEHSVPEDLCISFMEDHPHLRCLAWPMDMFFDSSRERRSERVEKIIANLANNLTELRVDHMYHISGEFLTEDSPASVSTSKSRNNRRLFISEFAAKMEKVEHIKLEGGIPRDERRETIRALGACPLQKIVLIGVNCPVGNTWGWRGQDVESHGLNEDLSDPDDLETLEYEDCSAITHLGAAKPTPPPPEQKFRAEYGWPPSAPLLHTLAAHHADTITEIKFCGYRGAPLLWDPTPITYPMYAPLRHFHNLNSLVLSLWLQTQYQGEYIDKTIIASWLDTRSSNSTALALVPDQHQPLTGLAKLLRDKFAPLVIARRIKDFVGPFLSERAKAKRNGVHIRGSFCIGMYGGIYDFEVRIGKAANGEDKLLDWMGPREELHPERRMEKLARRRWF